MEEINVVELISVAVSVHGHTKQRVIFNDPPKDNPILIKINGLLDEVEAEINGKSYEEFDPKETIQEEIIPMERDSIVLKARRIEIDESRISGDVYKLEIWGTLSAIKTKRIIEVTHTNKSMFTDRVLDMVINSIPNKIISSSNEISSINNTLIQLLSNTGEGIIDVKNGSNEDVVVTVSHGKYLEDISVSIKKG